MNIVYTAESLGGAARYVYESVRAMAELEHSILLLCPKNFEYREELSRIRHIRVQTTGDRTVGHRAGWAAKIREYLQCDAVVMSTLFRCAARERSVIHFNFGGHFAFLLPLMLGAKLLGIKVILTVHDPVPHQRATGRREVFERWLHGRVFGAADRLLIHNPDAAVELSKRYGIEAGVCSVVPHGAYDVRGAGAAPDAAGGPLKVLLFGGLRENKGIRLAIEAVQAVNREQELVELSIVGSLQDERDRAYWNDCKKLIDTAPRGIVIREGYVEQAKVEGIFSACHLVVLPYTHFCSQSGVAMMALSNARALLATPVGGIAELVSGSGGGLFLREPSTAALVEGLERALAMGRPELARLGLCGQAAVKQQCGWRQVAALTAEVYDSVRGNYGGAALRTNHARNRP